MALSNANVYKRVFPRRTYAKSSDKDASWVLEQLPECSNCNSTEAVVAACSRRLTSLVQKGAERSSPLIVGLVGAPASGKSTLAAQISSFCNNNSLNIALLPMDGFHLRLDTLQQMEDSEYAIRMRGAHWTFDAHALAHTLRQIKQAKGGIIGTPSFDHAIGDPVANDILINTATTNAVLVEGNYLHLQLDGWSFVSECFDELWYLDASINACKNRLIERHVATGIAPDHPAAHAKVEECDGPNAELVQQEAHRCHYRVPSIDYFPNNLTC